MQDFQEFNQECADEPPESNEVPYLDREALKGKLPQYREDLDQARRAYLQLKENYPDFFARMREQNPNALHHLDRMSDIIMHFNMDERFSDDRLLESIDEYNGLARSLNATFERTRLDREEAPDKVLVTLAEGRGVDPHFFETLTEEQKREIIAFGQALYQEIFPDSYVDTAVKYYTHRPELSDFQRYALMPANAIENVGKGFAGLFSTKAWEDLVQSAKTMWNMTEEDYKAAWNFVKFQYEHLSRTDKVEPALTFILSFTFLVGGVFQLSKFVASAPHATAIVALVESLALARSVTYNVPTLAKPLPAAVLGDLRLKYL